MPSKKFNPSSLPSLVEIEKERAHRNFAYFVKKAWPILEPGTPLAWGWALDAICEHLEAVTQGDIKRLLINVPPGCMKSLLLNVFWPAWEWGPQERPHLRYLGTAHKEALAIRDNVKCRRLIQSEWFQDRWPIEFAADQNARTKFENIYTGFREAMSFTSLTGSRGDRILLDDPISADAANSQAELHSAELTFKEALPTRINNKDSAIVVIMQRLHEKDTSGIILSERMKYEHLCLPMRFEPNRRCKTSIGFVDPRKKDGELLFPERFSEEQVQHDEKILGSYAVAGQFQQRPTPRGGGIIKLAWFQHYSVAPQIRHRAIFADTAQKTKEQNDYSVFQCWGLGRDKRAYLLDQIRGKWEAPELLLQAKAFWTKHKAISGQGVLRAMKIEDKSSGTGLIQSLRKVSGIPIIPVDRVKDKITRAFDAVPYIESGLVVLPESPPWLSDFHSEAEAFPSGAHDDQLDPMFDAIMDLLANPAGAGFSRGMTT